jgi:hypothetical protein
MDVKCPTGQINSPKLEKPALSEVKEQIILLKRPECIKCFSNFSSEINLRIESWWQFAPPKKGK